MQCKKCNKEIPVARITDYADSKDWIKHCSLCEKCRNKEIDVPEFLMGLFGKQ